MKPSDILIDLGSPVAYYPGLAKKVGGVKAAILFCQLFFWTGKEKKKDGWLYKDQKEIENETGLSPKEQRTARKELLKSKVFEERNSRTEHRIYYRIRVEILDKLLSSGHVPNGTMPPDHVPNGIKASAQREHGKCPTVTSLNRNLTETTQENTQESPPKKTLTESQSIIHSLCIVMRRDEKIKRNIDYALGVYSNIKESPTKPRAELILDKYGPGGWFSRNDWRGKKGEAPNLESICETWGRWNGSFIKKPEKQYYEEA